MKEKPEPYDEIEKKSIEELEADEKLPELKMSQKQDAYEEEYLEKGMHLQLSGHWFVVRRLNPPRAVLRRLVGGELERVQARYNYDKSTERVKMDTGMVYNLKGHYWLVEKIKAVNVFLRYLTQDEMTGMVQLMRKQGKLPELKPVDKPENG